VGGGGGVDGGVVDGVPPLNLLNYPIFFSLFFPLSFIHHHPSEQSVEAIF